jgi:hypothetical protein
MEKMVKCVTANQNFSLFVKGTNKDKELGIGVASLSIGEISFKIPLS